MKTFLEFLSERSPTSTSISKEVVTKIDKLIKDAAMKKEYVWLNALDLVHKAYSVCKVERPVPSDTVGWAQYEEHISLAVRCLQQSTDEGIRDDSWKMTTVGTYKRDYT